MQRPKPSSTPATQSKQSSQVHRIPGTIFLLSISRDEDDAAAIRADLKRSQLRDYKLQHCPLLEDAAGLLQVCSFDLAVLRLDDFTEPAAAIDRLRALDSAVPVIGLATGRLLASQEFAVPAGLSSVLRVEDLSPSLLEMAVRATLAERRETRARLRLEQELQLALEAGQLGAWSYDLENDLLEIDPIAATLLGFPTGRFALPLDKAIDNATRDAQATVKAAFRSAAKGGALLCDVVLESSKNPLPRLQISGRLQEPAGPETPRLFGVIRQADDSAAARQTIESANRALDAAIQSSAQALENARAELADLASALPSSQRPAETRSAAPEQVAPAKPPQPRPDPTPQAASKPAPNPPPPTPVEPRPAAEELGIDKQTAFQNVLRSLARQQQDDDCNARSVTFPFDFSADADLDYSEPDPSSEGFVGAAKRLVSITQRGHGLRVSMSIDEPSFIESEIEREMLFDILRELLINVVKHAKASLCIISLFRDEDDWVLQVEDDGVGLDKSLVSVSAPLNQIGLFRIRTQLALKGGHLDIAPSSPRGFVARARLPVSLRRNRSEAERA